MRVGQGQKSRRDCELVRRIAKRNEQGHVNEETKWNNIKQNRN